MRRIIQADVYLVAMWPSPETTDDTLIFMEQTYLALSFSYNCSVQMIREPRQLMNLRTLPHVAIEQQNPGTTPIEEFIHPERAVYLVGNSKHPTPSYWADTDHAVHISTPGTPDYSERALSHPLYGCQAAAIALHERERFFK